MNENKKVALYCCYSTHSQDGSFSIDIQFERMKATVISFAKRYYDFNTGSLFKK